MKQRNKKTDFSVCYYVLRKLLTGKGTIRAGEGTIRAGRSFQCPLSSFEYFEMQNYCQNEPKFNSFYLRNSLPKIKDWAICNTLDEYEVIGNDYIALYVNGTSTLRSNLFQ